MLFHLFLIISLWGRYYETYITEMQAFVLSWYNNSHLAKHCTKCVKCLHIKALGWGRVIMTFYWRKKTLIKWLKFLSMLLKASHVAKSSGSFSILILLNLLVSVTPLRLPHNCWLVFLPYWSSLPLPSLS